MPDVNMCIGEVQLGKVVCLNVEREEGGLLT